jgi:hypothetical protein
MQTGCILVQARVHLKAKKGRQKKLKAVPACMAVSPSSLTLPRLLYLWVSLFLSSPLFLNFSLLFFFAFTYMLHYAFPCFPKQLVAVDSRV